MAGLAERGFTEVGREALASSLVMLMVGFIGLVIRLILRLVRGC